MALEQTSIRRDRRWNKRYVRDLVAETKTTRDRPVQTGNLSTETPAPLTSQETTDGKGLIKDGKLVIVRESIIDAS